MEGNPGALHRIVRLLRPDRGGADRTGQFPCAPSARLVWSFDTSKDEAELLRDAMLAFKDESLARALSIGFESADASTDNATAARALVTNLLKQKQAARFKSLMVVLGPPLGLAAIAGGLAVARARRRAREADENDARERAREAHERDAQERRRQAEQQLHAEQRQAREQYERDVRELFMRIEEERAAKLGRPCDSEEASREWWSVLEVSPHASAEEIRRAYLRKIQQCHPDRVAGLASEFRELAERRTKALNAAYDLASSARHRM